jgi:ABC-type bacteriocin/lantibiotic exporter with double-glycine peptidase domain
MGWEETKEKLDKIWVGLVFGGLLPVIGFFVSKLFKDREGSYSVQAYWNLLIGQNDYYLDILTFSLIPNLLAFYFFFFMWKMDQALKGLIFMTIIYLGFFLIIH